MAVRNRSNGNVAWDDVRDAALRAFKVWVDQPELEWARRAWKALKKHMLTSYRNEFDRYRVFFRLLVLGGIYRDFCDAAWDERSEPEYSDWAEPLKLDPFLLGQLYASLADWNPEDEDTVDQALDTLVENERDEVVAGLRSGFGGDTELYESLWNSRGSDENDDDTYEACYPQLKAYDWVADGCQRYR